MHRYLFVSAAALSLIAACAKQDKAPAGDTSKAPPASAPAPAPATPSKVGETAGMQTPESVRYDPELDVYFVSNINGNPSQHDNNGFIAVVRADSAGAPPKKLIEGGQNGVTLDAPKGLALVADTLWVADIDHVRAFNRTTGAKVADIDLSKRGATFLNAVAIGCDGAVYVTDTGLMFDSTGTASHPGKDQIFKIAGRRVTVMRPDSLNAPNGITWDAANSRFLLAPFSGKAVQTWKQGDKSTTTLATGAGQFDGIEVLKDGRILVSSWADSTVDVVQNGALSKLITGVGSPADIGVDTKRMVVAIPRFNDNKVEYYKIP
ncbi:MAG: SMP-30/gluconolactonase/LRE family protein [Gemmatimonadaceae bacterium]